jgi:hypothetical protein
MARWLLEPCVVAVLAGFSPAPPADGIMGGIFDAGHAAADSALSLRCEPRDRREIAWQFAELKDGKDFYSHRSGPGKDEAERQRSDEALKLENSWEMLRNMVIELSPERNPPGPVRPEPLSEGENPAVTPVTPPAPPR